MFTTPYLDSHSRTDPQPEILSAVLTGNRIPHDGRNVRGTCAEKTTSLGKDDLTIVEWGEELHLEECTRPELTQP